MLAARDLLDYRRSGPDRLGLAAGDRDARDAETPERMKRLRQASHGIRARILA